MSVRVKSLVLNNNAASAVYGEHGFKGKSDALDGDMVYEEELNGVVVDCDGDTAMVIPMCCIGMVVLEKVKRGRKKKGPDLGDVTAPPEGDGVEGK